MRDSLIETSATEPLAHTWPVSNIDEARRTIHTPVDERGLIMIPELIKVVKDTVDASYVWTGKPNVHHFYPAHLYPYDYGSPGNPGAFSNLPIHKGLMFRSFHQWLELITIPPPQPSVEVRKYRIEAWAIAKALFAIADKSIDLEMKTENRRKLIASNPGILSKEFNGEDKIGEEWMIEQFLRNFRGLDIHNERNKKIPEEHRIVELEKPPKEIARDLGVIVTRNYQNCVPLLKAA